MKRASKVFQKATAGVMGIALLGAMTPAYVAPQDALAAHTNNVPAKATKLTYGKSVVDEFSDYATGSSWSLADHWYKFKTTSRRSVYKVKLESMDGNGFGLSVRDSENNEQGYIWRTSSADVKTLYDLDRNSEYLIEAESYDNTRYSEYRLTVTEHPVIKAVHSVKAINVKKKSFALKWDKQANATKYQVRYKKARGGKWQVRTAKGSSITLKSLKRKTKYSVQVRAYAKNGFNLTKDKVTSWSNWGSAKAVKTK